MEECHRSVAQVGEFYSPSDILFSNCVDSEKGNSHDLSVFWSLTIVSFFVHSSVYSIVIKKNVVSLSPRKALMDISHRPLQNHAINQ